MSVDTILDVPYYVINTHYENNYLGWRVIEVYLILIILFSEDRSEFSGAKGSQIVKELSD